MVGIGRPRVKSERELRWERENSEQINESMKKIREDSYKEQSENWRRDGSREH
jgi:hypothetical protein